MTESFDLVVNGAPRRVEAPGDTPLLHALRNILDLKGTRFGCGAEECGACMVLIDGAPRMACTVPLDAAAGKAVTTIEGLGTGDGPHPIQAAFLAENAGQCGYCLSGIIISAAALLKRNPRPARAEIAEALAAHLCRCGAHERIIRAIHRAGEAGAAP
jgi:nicotinate dehydrogenase subunit A